MPLPFSVPTPTNKKSFHPAASSESLAAFRDCYQRYEQCSEFAGSQGASTLLDLASSFVLDFEIIAKRALGSDTLRYRLFQLHFLKNASRTTCCSQLKLTEWAFASEVLAIKVTVGSAFKVAGLFPLAPYFSEAREKIAA